MQPETTCNDDLEALRQEMESTIAHGEGLLLNAIAYGDWQGLEDWIEELKQEFKYPQLPIPPESEGISSASISVIFD